MLDSVAALLTYQAGIYFATRTRACSALATGTRPSRLTRRSPHRTGTSCLPSATMISGDGSARWRHSRLAIALRPTASAWPHYAELRPILAERLGTRSRAGVDRRAHRGGRPLWVGPDSRRAFRRPADRGAPAWWRRWSMPTARFRARAGNTVKAVGDAGHRSFGAADARTAHRRHPRRRPAAAGARD